MHIGVPQGYFDTLKSRLSDIPSQDARVSPWDKVRPYITLAACFVVSVTAGSFLLNRTTGEPEGYYDYLAAADLIPVTDPFFVMDPDAIEEIPAIGLEDLIESGLTLEQIEDAFPE